MVGWLLSMRSAARKARGGDFVWSDKVRYNKHIILDNGVQGEITGRVYKARERGRSISFTFFPFCLLLRRLLILLLLFLIIPLFLLLILVFIFLLLPFLLLLLLLFFLLSFHLYFYSCFFLFLLLYSSFLPYFPLLGFLCYRVPFIQNENIKQFSFVIRDY